MAKKAVSCYGLNGKFIKSFPSITAARVTLGIPQSSVSQCCSGILTQTGGYRFCYEGETRSFEQIHQDHLDTLPCKGNSTLCGKKGCAHCAPRTIASKIYGKMFDRKKNKISIYRVSFRSGVHRWFLHKKCGHSFYATPNNVYLAWKKNTKCEGCGFCAKKRLCSSLSCEICRKNSFASNPRSKFWSPNNKTIEGEYISARGITANSHKNRLHICETHGEFFMSPNHITTHNQWCPRCRKSKLEEKLTSIGEELGLCMEIQKTFPDLVYKKALHLDAYLLLQNSTNGMSPCIIEVDGLQHFDPTSVFYKPNQSDDGKKKKERFKTVQHRDKIKVAYAKEHGMSILHIDYRLIVHVSKVMDAFMLMVSKLDEPFMLVTSMELYYYLFDCFDGEVYLWDAGTYARCKDPKLPINVTRIWDDDLGRIWRP